VPWNDQIGALKSTAGGGEAPKQRNRDGERWIGDDAEGSSWQSNVTAICLDDDDVGPGVLLTKFASPRRVQFKGDDACASTKQWVGDRSGTCSDVEDEVTFVDVGAVDETLGPSTIESMPPPSRPLLGHGGPS
jgi:hypothetical protein